MWLIFFFCKNNVGIPGNKRSDFLGKAAASNGNNEINYYFCYIFYIKTRITTKSLLNWGEQFLHKNKATETKVCK